MINQTTYGFYGKLPCSGDFLRRDLSQGFVGAWDAWMQALLLTGAERLGDQWSPTYLSAPVWRFAIPAGICGPRTVAGMWMPSIDRVGRKFPFCIATESDLNAWSAHLAIQPVISLIEDAALKMLEDDAKMSDLEGALTRLPDPAMLSGSSHFVGPAATIMTAACTDKSRVLLTSSPMTTAALFDLDAEDWQELSDDPI